MEACWEDLKMLGSALRLPGGNSVDGLPPARHNTGAVVKPVPNRPSIFGTLTPLDEFSLPKRSWYENILHAKCFLTIKLDFGWAWALGDNVIAISIWGQSFWRGSYLEDCFETFESFKLRTYSSTSPTGGNQVDGLQPVWNIILVLVKPVPRAPRFFITRACLDEFVLDKANQYEMCHSWNDFYTLKFHFGRVWASEDNANEISIWRKF